MHMLKRRFRQVYPLLWTLPLVFLAWNSQADPKPDPKDEMEFSKWRNRPQEPFTDGKASFEKVKEELLKNYYDKGLSENDLYRAAVEGMLSNLDPELGTWNKLLSPTELKELQADIEGKIVGIGIEITFNELSGYADIMGVIPGTPAAKAGLKQGDQILKIDDQSFRGKQIRDMVYAIRGQAGSSIKLAVLQDAEVKILKLKREALVWDSVKLTMLDDAIALLTIRNFTDATPRLLKDHLSRLQNRKGLIIDLRGNEGGLLEKTIESTDLLLPKGRTIVRAKRRDGAEENIVAKNEALFKDLPIVVIVNGATKSGGEIMATALKMSGQATTVGSKTYGKWSAQHVYELPNRFAFKYTVAAFLAPNGSNLNGKGLVPDIAVELPEDVARKLQAQTDMKTRLLSDTQLQTAIQVIKLKKP